MWLERLGTVDEGIFIAFGVISGVILLLALVNLILTCCRKHRYPGYSVTQLLICSSAFICAAVLFRGVQPKWGLMEQLSPLCPIFIAAMLIGYTAYSASTMIISWALLLKYKWQKLHISDEWKLTTTVWALIITAGISAIVWISAFTPGMTFSQNLTSTNVYNQSVYMCDMDDGSNVQFIWHVTFSAYFALFLVLAIISLPVHYTLRLTRASDSPMQIAMAVSTLNATCCVVVALVVWFQLHREPYDDSYKYAIIGGLQLWMLLVTQVAVLVAEVMNRSDRAGQTYHQYNVSTGSGILYGKHMHDDVSVSDGDGTLNSAITMGYEE